MNPQGNTFPKTERLHSRKAIEALFAGGNRTLSAFPLRVVYKVVDEPCTQVLISVSKRHFKHAIDRNRAKRQIREAWRLHRDLLAAECLHLAFMWLVDEPQPSDLVQRKMKNLLLRIAEQIQGFTEQRTDGSTD